MATSELVTAEPIYDESKTELTEIWMTHDLTQNGYLLSCCVQHLWWWWVATIGAQVNDFGSKFATCFLFDASSNRWADASVWCVDGPKMKIKEKCIGLWVFGGIKKWNRLSNGLAYKWNWLGSKSIGLKKSGEIKKMPFYIFWNNLHRFNGVNFYDKKSSPYQQQWISSESKRTKKTSHRI